MSKWRSWLRKWSSHQLMTLKRKCRSSYLSRSSKMQALRNRTSDLLSLRLLVQWKSTSRLIRFFNKIRRRILVAKKQKASKSKLTRSSSIMTLMRTSSKHLTSVGSQLTHFRQRMSKCKSKKRKLLKRNPLQNLLQRSKNRQKRLHLQNLLLSLHQSQRSQCLLPKSQPLQQSWLRRSLLEQLRRSLQSKHPRPRGLAGTRQESWSLSLNNWKKRQLQEKRHLQNRKQLHLQPSQLNQQVSPKIPRLRRSQSPNLPRSNRKLQLRRNPNQSRSRLLDLSHKSLRKHHPNSRGKMFLDLQQNQKTIKTLTWMTRSDREDRKSETRLLKSRLLRSAHPNRFMLLRPPWAKSSQRSQIKNLSQQQNLNLLPKAHQKLNRLRLLSKLASPKLLHQQRSRANHLRRRASPSQKSQPVCQRLPSQRVLKRKASLPQSRHQKALPKNLHQRSQLPHHRKTKRDLDRQWRSIKGLISQAREKPPSNRQLLSLHLLKGWQWRLS